jgi:phytoene dehydrogenase-like protein
VDVIVVGAGVAGLVAAGDLAAAGIDVLVVDAADGVGGRVRSDRVDGFILDRGFQILLTGYPQVRRRIDIAALDLATFAPGARVAVGGHLARVADPLRRPDALASSVRSRVATAADVARLAALLVDVLRTKPQVLTRRPDTSTRARLEAAGFSQRMISLFWQPLFSGIGLDPDLTVTSRRFDLVLRTLARGSTGLPAAGMQAVSDQLAERVPALRLNSPVTAVTATSVTLGGGEQLTARQVIVATDGPTAARLTGLPDPGSSPVACVWAALPPGTPADDYLLLDGSGLGPAVNIAPVSAVQPTYSPDGRLLVAAAVPGPAALMPGMTEQVLGQIARRFNLTSGDVAVVRTDRIAHGQPVQRAGHPVSSPVTVGDLLVCGDHRATASLQGAMASGQRAADTALDRLSGR